MTPFRNISRSAFPAFVVLAACTGPHPDGAVAERGALVVAEQPAGVAPGGYMFTAVFTGDNVRARLLVDGARVAEVEATGEPQELSVPVYVPSSDSVLAIEARDPNGPAVPGQLAVEAMALAPAKIGYTSAGGRVLDPDGQPFVPRGFNHGVSPEGQLSAAAAYVDEDTLWLKNWGATAMRLALFEPHWLGTCPSQVEVSMETYHRRVDALVERWTNAGIWVFLTYQRNSPDIRTEPCAWELEDAHMPDRSGGQGAGLFWQEVAARYKDNPRVGFELYNEPNTRLATGAMDWDVWRNGNQQWMGFQELYDVVRSTGAQNLVLIPGDGPIGRDTRAASEDNWIDGYNIVYSGHNYCSAEFGNEDAAIEGPGDCTHLPPAAIADNERIWGDTRDHYPMVITEFGSRQSTKGRTFNQQVIDYAEQHGMGWIAFSYAPGDNDNTPSYHEFGLFTDSWFSHEPTVRGRAIRDSLWAAQGWTSWGGGPDDAELPGAIADLSASVAADAVALAWTAPGDDGDRGTASFYEVRYSSLPITPQTWSCPTTVHETDAHLYFVQPPSAAGQTENLVVPGWGTSAQRFFAIRTGDERSTKNTRLSDLSNLAVVNPRTVLNTTLQSSALCGMVYGKAKVEDSAASDGFSGQVELDAVAKNVAAVNVPGRYTIRARVRGTNAKARIYVRGVAMGAEATKVLPTFQIVTVSGVQINQPTDIVGVKHTSLLGSLGSDLHLDWIKIERE